MSDGEHDPPRASTFSTSSGTSTSTNSTATGTATTPQSGLPPFQLLDPSSDASTVGPRWKKWARRFENLLCLQEFDPTIRRGLLLTYVGDATNNVFDILLDTGTTYESAITALNQHFDPMQNKDLLLSLRLPRTQARNQRNTQRLLPSIENKSVQLQFHQHGRRNPNPNYPQDKGQTSSPTSPTR